MYQEDIARLTADHLRVHIEGYLAAENARHAKPVELKLPNAIEVASVVGGLSSELHDILPQYAVDAFGRAFAPTAESLWTYQYDGQINGMVIASGRSMVDLIVKRHQAAVIKFVHDHALLHKENNNDFAVVEFSFVTSDTSGAELVSEENDRQVWIAGFSVDVLWMLSEEGPEQHG